MKIVKNSVSLFLVVVMTFPLFATAQSMSSESFGVPAGFFGPGVFGVGSSENYTLGASGGEENNDTGGDAGGAGSSGGGLGDGASTGGLLPHVTSYDNPLLLLPSQSGTLIANTSAGQVVIDVPRGAIGLSTRVIVTETPLNVANVELVPEGVALMNSVFYDVVAIDSNGDFVTSFPNFITISLPLPASLLDGDGLAVYWLEEESSEWVLVPSAVFNLTEKRVSFQVNHLTRFAILNPIEEEKEEPLIIALEDSGLSLLPQDTSPSEEKVAFMGGVTVDFSIQNPSVPNIEELLARTTFTNLGEGSEVVEALFTIVDSDGASVYSTKEIVSVGRQEELVSRFNTSLGSGEYTLLLDVKYANGKTDNFTQLFNVQPDALNDYNAFFFWFIALLIAWYWFLRKKKKREEDTH